MQITDTIADLLTRIRNASTAKHATVDVPASNMKNHRTQKSIKAWSENLRKLRGYAKGYKGSWHCYRIYFKGRYHRQEG